MTKLTDKEIANLKKAISEAKENFDNSHLGEKRPKWEDIKALEEIVKRNNTEHIQFRIDGRDIAGILNRHREAVGFIRTPNLETVFRVKTAAISSEDLPMGSGITQRKTIISEVEIAEIGYNYGTYYLFRFNTPDRGYYCTVRMDNVLEQGDKLIAYMTVIGPLNITQP